MALAGATGARHDIAGIELEACQRLGERARLEQAQAILPGIGAVYDLTQAGSARTHSGRAKAMRRLNSRQLWLGITAGLMVGIMDIPIEISFATLIFSGALAAHVASGVGLALAGAVALAVVTALTSSHRGTIALPQDSPAVILALIAAAIVARMPPSAPPNAAFVTVVAAIALTSLVCGIALLVLGWCKLGSLVRYIPYPVIGGFLAGTGLLLVRGAMGMLVQVPLDLAHASALLGAHELPRWLPAFLFGALVLLVLRRYSHFLVLPGMLLGAVGLFYLLLRLLGTSIADAQAQGWLLGPFPSGALWPPLALSSLRLVHWPAIVAQAGNVATLLFISAISLLLNTSALEVTVRRDIDLNRELTSAGLANLIAGLGGGPAGYQALSLSALSHRMGAHSRLVGVVVGLLCGAMLLFGAPVLSYFPRPVLGGVLFFLGLAFIAEWVYDAYRKFGKAEYGIILLILITMNVAGVLAGVGLGLAFAVGLFVFDYSRVSPVKHALSGDSYHSTVDRPRAQSEILRARGDWLYILQLQGFMFFGTANNLLEQVRERLHAAGRPPLRFVVLDLGQVIGLDASAVLSLCRMKQLAQAEGMTLVFTQLSAGVRRQMDGEVFTAQDSKLWRIQADLDHGVEWCEDQILAMAACEAASEAASALPTCEKGTAFADLLPLLARHSGRQGGAAHPASIGDTGLGEYATRQEVPQGAQLIRQGDALRGLFFVESGQVTILREREDGSAIRLRKLGPGAIVGEMSVYRGTVASASVVADRAGIVYFLPAQELSRMEATQPELAATLHRYVAALLGERLAAASDTIQALLEPRGA